MDRQIKKSANKFAEIANTNSMFNENVWAKEAVVWNIFVSPLVPSKREKKDLVLLSLYIF